MEFLNLQALPQSEQNEITEKRVNSEKEFITQMQKDLKMFERQVRSVGERSYILAEIITIKKSLREIMQLI